MISAALYDVKPYDREYFTKASFNANVNWQFHEFRLSISTVDSAKGVETVCVFVNDYLDRACITRLSEAKVRLIALRCAGYNNVDLEAAKEFGITVVHVPAYSPHAVAEHSVGLLLALNRHIHHAHNRVREHNFSLAGLIGFDLAGKTVGIVGTGRIGRIAAQIYRGFGCQVIAHDINPCHDWAAQQKIEYMPFPALLSNSDIISLHLPLTLETNHLLCRDTFKQMKQGVYLVNTGRGGLIDTTALLEVLKTGFIGGIALDVYEREGGIFFEDCSEHILQDDELNLLLTYPNVLMTSHQAFLTREALSEIARITIENIVRSQTNQPYIDGTVL